MRKLYYYLLILITGCNNTAQILPEVKTHKPEKKDLPIAIKDSISEFYSDSTSIGMKGKNKIELKKIMDADSVYADLRFYVLINKRWKELQHFTLHKDGVIPCDPVYSDFNNDGFNDFNFTSSIAARSANDIRTLFIYNKTTGLLRLIKNSEEYPNLQYNADLDCLDAFAIYGGSTSYFLRIEKDSLRPFARVDLFDGYREVYRYEKTGKDRLIKRDTFRVSYLRYKNFDPLVEYKEF